MPSGVAGMKRGFRPKLCSLIRGVATHSKQDEDKTLNNKHSNPNSPGEGDFYFVEDKGNDDNVKSGRVIPQSAWSKEDKEPTRPDESKTESQLSDESSIKKLLSYLLNVVHELKRDIFGIKEMALVKETKELSTSPDSSEDKGKQNKMEENLDASKAVSLTGKTESSNKNQRPTSNYITEYYRENGNEFTDDEERDDEFKNFNDMSDDSSHKPNEGTSNREDSKNNENTRNFKCMEIKKKTGKCSFETRKTTAIPTSQTKIPEEGVQKFDENKESGKCNDCKESTIKPTKTEENHSKSSREETENGKAAPPNSKRYKCVKKNNKNSAKNLNGKNEPTDKNLKSDEYGRIVSPQNQDSDQEETKRPNEDKTVDNRSAGKNSKNKADSDFDNKPGVLMQSTTLTPQNSQDGTFPADENENGPKASGAPYEKQQEQNISPKSEDKILSQNNGKFPKANDGINEQTIVFSPPHKSVLEIPEHRITETYFSEIEINNSPKESKDEGSTVIRKQTIINNKENESNSEIDRHQTSNSFDIGNPITHTISGNILNTHTLNKNPWKNLSDTTETNENDKSKKSSPSKQDKNDSEILKDGVIEQSKIEEVNDDSKPEISLLVDSTTGNDAKKKNDHLGSTTTHDIPSQDSNQEIPNHGYKGSDKPQEAQKKDENLTKRTEMQDSPDEEYEYEEDTEDFDIWDESDAQDSDQNQEDEMNTNSGDYEKEDEINTGSTRTVFTNKSQTTQATGYDMEEKSEEQFDTFLEYFYKHSNNSFFQSLKNQSNSSSDDEDGY